MRDSRGDRRGRISIVGIGPGALDQLSQKAHKAIVESDTIVGYNTYIKLLGDLAAGKEVISSGMTQEKNRAQAAIDKALEGRRVSIISSGDPGIYGMAGIVLEILRSEDKKKIEIEIIPGVMAAAACASLLGAPLAHDFAVISLSDLLTDRREIEDRLGAAGKADFVIVLYNPKSKTRAEPLEKAWEIIAKYRSPSTPVGIVKNAFRDGEVVRIAGLKEASALKDIDMTTTVIVGNSKTYVKNGYMITPRGYKSVISNK